MDDGSFQSFLIGRGENRSPTQARGMIQSLTGGLWDVAASKAREGTLSASDLHALDMIVEEQASGPAPGSRARQSRLDEESLEVLRGIRLGCMTLVRQGSASRLAVEDDSQVSRVVRQALSEDEAKLGELYAALLQAGRQDGETAAVAAVPAALVMVNANGESMNASIIGLEFSVWMQKVPGGGAPTMTRHPAVQLSDQAVERKEKLDGLRMVAETGEPEAATKAENKWRDYLEFEAAFADAARLISEEPTLATLRETHQIHFFWRVIVPHAGAAGFCSDPNAIDLRGPSAGAAAFQGAREALRSYVAARRGRGAREFAGVAFEGAPNPEVIFFAALAGDELRAVDGITKKAKAVITARQTTNSGGATGHSEFCRRVAQLDTIALWKPEPQELAEIEGMIHAAGLDQELRAICLYEEQADAQTVGADSR